MRWKCLILFLITLSCLVSPTRSNVVEGQNVSVTNSSEQDPRYRVPTLRVPQTQDPPTSPHPLTPENVGEQNNDTAFHTTQPSTAERSPLHYAGAKLLGVILSAAKTLTDYFPGLVNNVPEPLVNITSTQTSPTSQTHSNSSSPQHGGNTSQIQIYPSNTPAIAHEILPSRQSPSLETSHRESAVPPRQRLLPYQATALSQKEPILPPLEEAFSEKSSVSLPEAVPSDTLPIPPKENSYTAPQYDGESNRQLRNDTSRLLGQNLSILKTPKVLSSETYARAQQMPALPSTERPLAETSIAHQKPGLLQPQSLPLYNPSVTRENSTPIEGHIYGRSAVKHQEPGLVQALATSSYISPQIDGARTKEQNNGSLIMGENLIIPQTSQPDTPDVLHQDLALGHAQEMSPSTPTTKQKVQVLQPVESHLSRESALSQLEPVRTPTNPLPKDNLAASQRTQASENTLEPFGRQTEAHVDTSMVANNQILLETPTAQQEAVPDPVERLSSKIDNTYQTDVTDSTKQAIATSRSSIAQPSVRSDALKTDVSDKQSSLEGYRSMKSSQSQQTGAREEAKKVAMHDSVIDKLSAVEVQNRISDSAPGSVPDIGRAGKIASLSQLNLPNQPDGKATTTGQLGTGPDTRIRRSVADITDDILWDKNQDIDISGEGKIKTSVSIGVDPEMDLGEDNGDITQLPELHQDFDSSGDKITKLDSDVKFGTESEADSELDFDIDGGITDQTDSKEGSQPTYGRQYWPTVPNNMPTTLHDQTTPRGLLTELNASVDMTSAPKLNLSGVVNVENTSTGTTEGVPPGEHYITRDPEVYGVQLNRSRRNTGHLGEVRGHVPRPGSAHADYTRVFVVLSAILGVIILVMTTAFIITMFKYYRDKRRVIKSSLRSNDAEAMEKRARTDVMCPSPPPAPQVHNHRYHSPSPISYRPCYDENRHVIHGHNRDRSPSSVREEICYARSVIIRNEQEKQKDRRASETRNVIKHLTADRRHSLQEQLTLSKHVILEEGVDAMRELHAAANRKQLKEITDEHLGQWQSWLGDGIAAGRKVIMSAWSYMLEQEDRFSSNRPINDEQTPTAPNRSWKENFAERNSSVSGYQQVNMSECPLSPGQNQKEPGALPHKSAYSEGALISPNLLRNQNSAKEPAKRRVDHCDDGVCPQESFSLEEVCYRRSSELKNCQQDGQKKRRNSETRKVIQALTSSSNTRRQSLFDLLILARDVILASAHDKAHEKHVTEKRKVVRRITDHGESRRNSLQEDLITARSVIMETPEHKETRRKVLERLKVLRYVLDDPAHTRRRSSFADEVKYARSVIIRDGLGEKRAKRNRDCIRKSVVLGSSRFCFASYLASARWVIINPEVILQIEADANERSKNFIGHHNNPVLLPSARPQRHHSAPGDLTKSTRSSRLGYEGLEVRKTVSEGVARPPRRRKPTARSIRWKELHCNTSSSSSSQNTSPGTSPYTSSHQIGRSPNHALPHPSTGSPSQPSSRPSRGPSFYSAQGSFHSFTSLSPKPSPKSSFHSCIDSSTDSSYHSVTQKSRLPSTTSSNSSRTSSIHVPSFHSTQPANAPFTLPSTSLSFNTSSPPSPKPLSSYFSRSSTDIPPLLDPSLPSPKLSSSHFSRSSANSYPYPLTQSVLLSHSAPVTLKSPWSQSPTAKWGDHVTAESTAVTQEHDTDKSRISAPTILRGITGVAHHQSTADKSTRNIAGLGSTLSKKENFNRYQMDGVIRPEIILCIIDPGDEAKTEAKKEQSNELTNHVLPRDDVIIDMTTAEVEETYQNSH
ncbi:uncharacterized protein LOC5522360 isoform X2 [Nematostella vectensis]|uniref:uncharacterized protein LOC5522360 isoform X2 n=1 Tax=Nematostella vectensis TaxID=45351 RepID=UPI0020772BE4|nr:uncharacterized protein LOC5522360 isoform X2 [Nematostella vectensis]